MPYSANLVAYAFVKMGISEDNPVTQMKLQKLVYFAHGFYLAQYDDALINEKFQAWEYGPVIPEIYQKYRIYGSSLIDDTTVLLIAPSFQKEIKELYSNPNVKEILKVTWDALKTIDAVTLSAWTHKKGSPWLTHYKNGVIPNDEIKSYFKQEFIKE